jgi:AcrR family transcriptional regulator
MPAPAKTSDAEIVAAAKRIVERSGIEALSMQAVAEAVDVRPPSLYKRFADRDALVRTVQRLAFEDLRAAIERVPSGLPAIERLSRMADAYRGFARKHRRLYSAMFYETAGRAPEEAAMRTAAAEPLLRAVASVVGESASLPAARLLTAFVHGFVSMELAHAFRLGGDVDLAYRYGVETLLGALGGTTPDPARGARLPESVA